MTNEQLEQFEQLESIQQRAEFLLDIGVSAKPNIIDLDVVSQACVGDVLLPITAATEELAIAKATAWLEKKARP